MNADRTENPALPSKCEDMMTWCGSLELGMAVTKEPGQALYEILTSSCELEIPFYR